MAEPRTVLLGDSHLARLRRALSDWPGEVVNRAVGGASAPDLARQAAAVDVADGDCVVVSVGTNDPWRGVPLPSFAEHLSALVASCSPRRWVLVAPPGVVEERLTHGPDRTNTLIDAYRTAAIGALEPVGGRVVRTDLLLAPLGARAFDGDGIHLNGAGYAVLVPALRKACAGGTSTITDEGRSAR